MPMFDHRVATSFNQRAVHREVVTAHEAAFLIGACPSTSSKNSRDTSPFDEPLLVLGEGRRIPGFIARRQPTNQRYSRLEFNSPISRRSLRIEYNTITRSNFSDEIE